jgi:hypothetical protein
VRQRDPASHGNSHLIIRGGCARTPLVEVCAERAHAPDESFLDHDPNIPGSTLRLRLSDRKRREEMNF